jgi:hypothetical protein
MHNMSLSDENLIIDCPVLSDAAPIVVGGVGGSGTRVIAQLLQSLNFDMGSDLNESLDDLSFTALFKRPSLWPINQHLSQLKEALDVYLASRGHKSTSWTSQAHQTARVVELLKSTRQKDEWIETGNLSDREQFLATASQPKPLWGWKEPNAHLPLPFLLAALPNMKYIHVTRHGLDMAYSSNQTQLKIWGSQLLGRAMDTRSADDSFAYWCAVHERVLTLQELANQQILILPFEGLFTDADSTLNNLCRFLGLANTLATARENLSALDAPKTIGRHRKLQRLNMSKANRRLLHRLRYEVKSPTGWS